MLVDGKWMADWRPVQKADKNCHFVRWIPSFCDSGSRPMALLGRPARADFRRRPDATGDTLRYIALGFADFDCPPAKRPRTDDRRGGGQSVAQGGLGFYRLYRCP